MITIEELRNLCTDETIMLTQHLQLRLRERNITMDDIMQGIQTGHIIEQYPTDYPYPSCLVLGIDISGTPLHVVCGHGHGRLWIITVYRPDPERWESDNETRKERSE